MKLNPLFYYALYGLSVLILFLYLLFPGERITAFLTSEIQQHCPDISITSAPIRFVPPMEFKVSKSKMSLNHMTPLVLDTFKVKPDLLSLFRNKKQILFKIKAYKGVVSGSLFTSVGILQLMDIPLSGYGMAFDGKDLTLNNFHHRIADADVNISCSISGAGKYDMVEGNRAIGRGNLQISQCSLDLDHKLLSAMGISRLNFTEVEIVYHFDGYQFVVEKCSAKGSEVTIEISGNIALKMPYHKTILDLRGSLRPEPSYLRHFAKIPSIAGLFTRSKRKGLPFKIKGNLGSPEVSL